VEPTPSGGIAARGLRPMGSAAQPAAPTGGFGVLLKNAVRWPKQFADAHGCEARDGSSSVNTNSNAK